MKELNLGKEKINKLLLTFTIPCVISMLTASIYNIVDQIFIGKGVGSLGNAATNVIFPLVIIFNAIAGLIGNGAAANLSLKLGEGNKKEASKTVGISITSSIIVSIFIAVISYFLLPKLIYLFGAVDSVYDYALSYGRIIAIGSFFMIIYSALSPIIRADNSPKYSMFVLVIGAVLNIILDPIFIFGFNWGVEGGAIATVIGQALSCILALLYIPRLKQVKLSFSDFIPDKTIFKILGLGLSSFITQATVLALFVFMNNMMTTLGSESKFGSLIPLSVYGVISKVNSLFISTVLGISIGSQPIIGFNYGAGNKERVKETIKKVLIANFSIGIIFNIMFVLFPTQIVSLFISKSDSNYALFIEFANLFSRSFLLLCSLNALEMTTSIVVQSLGNVKKATLVSFIRQIILFIPISCILAFVLNYGIYGVLYGGLCADILCFIISIFIFKSEYAKLDIKNDDEKIEVEETDYIDSNRNVIITIGREYGSGGRFVGRILAERLGIAFYDKELLSLAAKESGLSLNYISTNDEKKENFYYENDDRIYIAESKVIKKISKKSCVIVGRCADKILKDNKNVIRVFLCSFEKAKIDRVVTHYGLDKETAKKEIKRIDLLRGKHYKFYTGCNWKDLDNYDYVLNVDKVGVLKTVEILEKIVNEKNSFNG